MDRPIVQVMICMAYLCAVTYVLGTCVLHMIH